MRNAIAGAKARTRMLKILVGAKPMRTCVPISFIAFIALI